MRMALAAAALLPVWILLDGWQVVVRAPWIRGILIGGLMLGLAGFLLVIAQAASGPVTVAVISATMPVLGIALESLLDGRRITLTVVLGVGLFCAVMAVASSQYVWATRFQTTAATDIPISFVYAAMPVGFVLMLVHLLFIARGYVADGSFAKSDEMDADAAASI